MEQAQQEHLGGQPEVILWAGVCGHPAPAEAPSSGRAPFQHTSPCSPSELCGSWPRLKLAAWKRRKDFGQGFRLGAGSFRALHLAPEASQVGWSGA